MAFTKITKLMTVIASLGTKPQDRPLTTEQFKAKFDEESESIKGTFNTLIDDMLATTNGKGASQIGIEDSATRYTATNVETALAEIAGTGRTTETVKSLADLISTVSGVASAATGLFKANYTTHDLSVSGAHAVTGVGFQPKSVLFFADVDNVVGKMSIGASAGGTSNIVMINNHNVTANSFVGDASSCIEIINSSGNYTKGTIQSLDADGFTLNWTKTGTGATGTATILYLAMR